MAPDFRAKVRTGGLAADGSRMSPPTAKSANFEGAFRARFVFTGASGYG